MRQPLDRVRAVSQAMRQGCRSRSSPSPSTCFDCHCKSTAVIKSRRPGSSAWPDVEFTLSATCDSWETTCERYTWRVSMHGSASHTNGSRCRGTTAVSTCAVRCQAAVPRATRASEGVRRRVRDAYASLSLYTGPLWHGSRKINGYSSHCISIRNGVDLQPKKNIRTLPT